ncbi:MAG: TonB-dependent receptor [Chloroherpetonaceae bacterium]|nr:TonB-dependent receptor [Chloroherpetonaceae bacterium]
MGNALRLAASALLFLFVFASFSATSYAQGSIKGSVVDEKTGEALAGATIRLLASKYGAKADANGKFALSNLPEGFYKVQVSYVGYKAVVKNVIVQPNETVTLDVKMQSMETYVNEVVVTASKGRQEKKLEAPITIETIGFDALKQTASTSALGAAAKLKGVDFVERGVNTVDITSRGLNTQFNTRMLTLVDGRLATLPGLGLPQFTLAPNPTLDIASVEVAVGPAAALYGPNAHAGVVNIITKDPFSFSGAEVQVRGGTQSLYDIGLRYADHVGSFGWKVTGQLMSAKQFESGNVFTYSRSNPTALGENQTLVNRESPNPISRQDLERMLLDGRAFRETQLSAMEASLRKIDGGLYYQAPSFNAKVAAGYAQSTGFVGSNFGVLEANGYVIQYQNAQLSGQTGDLSWFAQVTRTANEAGNSFQLHDKAEFMAAEFLRSSGRLGFVDAQGRPIVPARIYSSPSLYDSIYSRMNFAAIDSAARATDKSQLYDSEIQLRYAWSGLEIVGGFQYRYYNPSASFLSGFDNPAAVNFGAARDITATEIGGYLQLDKRFFDNKLRATLAARYDKHTYYDPQFSPKVSLVYSFTPNQNLRLSFNRAFKVPVILENHLFLLGGLARGNVNGWTVVQGGTQPNGAPSNTLNEALQNGGTIQARYNRLSPEQVNSFELGYKGVISDKLFFDVVGYYSIYKNFISPAFEIAGGAARNAFAYDKDGNLLRNTLNQPGRLVTYFNYGSATIIGGDFGLTYFISPDVSLETSFSFINLADSENPFERQGIPLVLNVPTTKYKATLSARNQLVKNSFFALHGRHIPGYLFRAGRWNGRLNDRTVVDLTLGYEWKPQGLTFQLGFNNIFDNKTPDVLGAPIMRRFISATVTYGIGGFAN